MRHIWTRFLSLSTTEARERSSGGTGLGLTIAKRGVEVNGGSIKAENGAQGGLLVTITLPQDLNAKV